MNSIISLNSLNFQAVERFFSQDQGFEIKFAQKLTKYMHLLLQVVL